MVQDVFEGVVKPRLLMGIPCTRDVPCRQPTCFEATTQLVATLVTYGWGDGVAVLP